MVHQRSTGSTRTSSSSRRVSSIWTTSPSTSWESDNSGHPSAFDEKCPSSKSSSNWKHIGLAFLAGFTLAGALFSSRSSTQRQLRLFSAPTTAADTLTEPAENAPLPDPSHSMRVFNQVEPGIYPLLRDFQCGHANLETPLALAQGSHGRGRFVVDVGLGADGQEALDAIANGFIVFGFEMNAGSMAGIKQEAAKRDMTDRIHFVEFESTHDGKAKPKALPKPPQGEQGFAYIFIAGLSDASGAITNTMNTNPTADLSTKKIWPVWEGAGTTPILTLEEALPEWAQNLFYVKIDTQGWEAKVLGGMNSLLKANRIQYVQYEFSPWLMTKAKSGDALDLLQLLPSMGAVCFDMMGQHNKLTRPSRHLQDYFRVLNDGLNGSRYNASVAQKMYQSDKIGPWDDILCWFPAATK